MASSKAQIMLLALCLYFKYMQIKMIFMRPKDISQNFRNISLIFGK